MTVAICYKCGAFKWGAFTSCEKCGAKPSTLDDLAISMAISDHHFEKGALERIGTEIQAGKPAPIDPSQINAIKSVLGGPISDRMFSMLKGAFGPDAATQPTRKRRRDDIFESLNNQKEIASIVCRHFRSGSGAVTYRANPFLQPDLVMGAKMVLKKPFLTSWSSFIPKAALSEPGIFECFAARIFITTEAREASNDFWDGKGNYQKHVKLADISAFTGLARIAAFGVLLAEPVYFEVRQYLELPPEKPGTGDALGFQSIDEMEATLDLILEVGALIGDSFYNEPSLKWPNARRWARFCGLIPAFACVVAVDFLEQRANGGDLGKIAPRPEQKAFYKSIEDRLFKLFEENRENYMVKIRDCLPLASEKREILKHFGQYEFDENTNTGMDMILGIILPVRFQKYYADWIAGIKRKDSPCSRYVAMRVAADLLGVITPESLAGHTPERLALKVPEKLESFLTYFYESYLREVRKK